MRKLFLAVSVLSAVVVLAGCPKKKTTEDPEAGAGDAAALAPPPVEDAAPAPPPAPVAKNANEVARFGTETPVEDDDMKIASVANARTTPKGGSVVATVRPGMDVTKVAEYQDCILVTFADPKDASSTLMGWVEKAAFTAPVRKVDAGPRDAAAPVVVDAGPKPLTCAAGQVAVTLSAAPVCKKKCTKDGDCKTPPCSPASGPGGKVVRVCAADP